MMKERYESLPLTELRAVAKARGLKGISSLRKEQLVERMLQEDENDRARAEAEAAGRAAESRAAASNVSETEGKTVSADADRGAAGTDRKPAGADRKPAGADRKPAGADRKTSGADRKSSGADRKSAGVSRKTASSAKDTAPDQEAAARTQADGAGRKAVRQEQAGVSARETHAADLLPQDPDPEDQAGSMKPELQELDSGNEVYGILEVMQDGFGFIRSDNYMPGENDIYVSPSQIRRFGLRTGDMLRGNTRLKTMNEKFSALLYVKSINGMSPSESAKRINFESMTPIFPDERIRLERPGGSLAMRIVDLVSPIGKGQRGMIVSPPKAGKTTLLKDTARSVLRNNPEMHIIILLIDERPEEVTDIRETVHGKNVEVIYSTFDETAEHHKRVSEMAIERARRMVEQKKDVIIFIDSITRLARAYNQVIPASGRTLSGGLDPAALHMPKRFFGAARNMREGGSLTILATALVDTGSKMDDVVYEEFKGTGNMELILDRKLQERRVFPAIDLSRSGTRREDLLLTPDEQEAVGNMRRALNGLKAEEAGETILNMFAHTRTNRELVEMLKKKRIV